MIKLITANCGTKYLGYSNDHLFKEIEGGNTFIDSAIKKVIDDVVTPDSVCIDAGSNLGYITMYLAKRCKKVFAFEPQKVVYLQLCGNLFLNECFNVTPYNLGVYHESKNFTFSKFQDGWVGKTDFKNYNEITSIGSISIEPNPEGEMKCVRLDEQINERVDFIKFDCEGGDIDGILGAEKLIERFHPKIVFEYHTETANEVYHRPFSDIYDIARRHKYKLIQIDVANYLLS